MCGCKFFDYTDLSILIHSYCRHGKGQLQFDDFNTSFWTGDDASVCRLVSLVIDVFYDLKSFNPLSIWSLKSKQVHVLFKLDIDFSGSRLGIGSPGSCLNNTYSYNKNIRYDHKWGRGLLTSI